MKSNLKPRMTNDFSIGQLPFDTEHENIALQDPTSIRVKLSCRVTPLDIGSWAYARRNPLGGAVGKNRRYSSCSDTAVDKSSLRKERVTGIINYLEYIYTAYRTGSLREMSILGEFMKFDTFLNWADTNDFPDLLVSIERSKAAINAYVNYLENNFRTGKIARNTAAMLQNSALKGLGQMISANTEDLSSGTRLIATKEASATPTAPPPKEDVDKVISLSTQIFDQLTGYLTNNSPYPLALKVNKTTQWVFPTGTWTVMPSQLKERENWKAPGWAWDYERGRISKVDEIEHKVKRTTPEASRRSAIKAIRNAQNLLQNANTNPKHHARISLAVLAHDSFLILFLANTGMNYAQVRDLEWEDNYTVTKNHQGFRAIKYRASGKEVEFYIGEKFLRRFKIYLELRRFILSERIFPKLFVSLTHKGEPIALKRGAPTQYSELIQNFIDETFPIITSREWRANKSDYLIKNTDVATTAMLLQNSEKTTLRSYSEGSEIDAEESFGKYYEDINQKIFENPSIPDHTPSSVGHCAKKGSPTFKESGPIRPDCSLPEGCLFCDNYAVHADSKDVRKLLSLSYVIKETESLSNSASHYQQVFGEVLLRIESILAAISNRSEKLSKLVHEITEDVNDNENLDKYWAAKLECLVKIGAL